MWLQCSAQWIDDRLRIDTQWCVARGDVRAAATIIAACKVMYSIGWLCPVNVSTRGSWTWLAMHINLATSVAQLVVLAKTKRGRIRLMLDRRPSFCRLVGYNKASILPRSLPLSCSCGIRHLEFGSVWHDVSWLARILLLVVVVGWLLRVGCLVTRRCLHEALGVPWSARVAFEGNLRCLRQYVSSFSVSLMHQLGQRRCLAWYVCGHGALCACSWCHAVVSVLAPVPRLPRGTHVHNPACGISHVLHV